MHSRYARIVLIVVAAICVVPGGATATPYRLDGPRAISSASPFAAGCPSAQLDATAIAGHELETAVTVNPADSRNIIATWKQDVGPQTTRSDLVASSLDGGKTWARTTMPGLSACTGGSADASSDPWVS